DDAIRKRLAQTMRLGLVRFAARTPVADKIEISYEAPAQAATAVKDRWNYWVFSAGVNTNYSAEQSQNFFNVGGELEANRITQTWKIELEVGGSYNESNFHFREDSVTAFTFRNLQRNYRAEGTVVRSLGPHWAAGFRGITRQRTFSNEDLLIRVAPVLEFDVFPYSQSTRRLLTIQYAPGVSVFDYAD